MAWFLESNRKEKWISSESNSLVRVLSSIVLALKLVRCEPMLILPVVLREHAYVRVRVVVPVGC